MERDQAIKFMHELLQSMAKRGGSDLFITAGFPPAVKVDGNIAPVTEQPLSPEHSAMLVRAIMNDRQNKEFDAHKECNFAINAPGAGRFRVSAFVQQGHSGAVLRALATDIPALDALELPSVLEDVTMSKRGLVLVVGATGTGKSTTLAAMLGYRNQHTHDHIVTIEDPIEFVHPHLGCVITQRELGVDTDSWELALKNTLRQAPDVIFIGEIRGRQTMQHAVQFAETGHLCLSTLHANNANQALARIIALYPEDRREQLLMDLSLNLRAVISQRLVRRQASEGRAAAVEIMLNSPLISDLICKGEIATLKEIIAKSPQLGMQTFDQALFRLYENATISYLEAIRNADSQNELRLRIKLESNRERRSVDAGVADLSLIDNDGGRVL